MILPDGKDSAPMYCTKTIVKMKEMVTMLYRGKYVN